ncbi:MAG: DUF296 domain-containing protein [Candidatus Wolfebacteria bacterium]|nr:DUF296 domain-containing protein [Candidatus Wolfebacteria bacterium]
MKVILKDGRRYIIRFDRNEEAIEGLVYLCEAEKIEAATFYALGASEEIIISYYNLPEKKYYDKEIKEGMEIINLIGSVAKMKNKTIIHAHGNFAGADFKPIAGHVKKLVVGPTCEVFLIKLEGKIEREFSDEIGLNLMK